LQQNRIGRWALLFLVATLLTLPILQVVAPERKLVSNALLFAFTQMFLLVVLASNWNLTGGFTGYIDFGHAVFFGLGAYGTGILMNKLDWPFPAAMIVGAITAAVFAVLIGSATLRLKGPYFSIAMLGTFVAMREIIRVARPITGGGQGLTLPPYLNRPLFYYVALFLAIAVIGLVWYIRRSEFGSTLIAIREDEVGAEMRGINTTLHKITVFWIAAFLTGIVGGIWAYQNTFIDPDVVFFSSRTVELVMMVMLGGIGTVAGPVVGAATIYWMRDVVWSNFEQFHLMVEGLLLIVIVLFVPGGIVGSLGDRTGTSLKNIVRGWSRK
jgi:branched-chain amino acid transport system permease protein